MRVLSPDQIGIWSVGFCGGRKSREPGGNPWSRARTNNKLSSLNYDTWLESNPVLIGALTTAPSLLPEQGWRNDKKANVKLLLAFIANTVPFSSNEKYLISHGL